MDIELRNISEGTAIALFAEAAKKLQKEKDDEIKSLKGNIESLKQQKADLDKSVREKDNEIKILRGNIESLEKENETLENQKADLDKDNNDKEQSLDILKSKLKENRLCSVKRELTRLEVALKESLESVTENDFADFIKEIKDGIHETVQRNSMEDIGVDFKVSSGWLAKLASLYWWGTEEHVSHCLPEPLRKEANLIKTFEFFLNYLSETGININIPSCGFSYNIEKYGQELDGNSETFKRLFPMCKLDEDVLCQISKLSCNDENGRCILFKN